MGKSRRWLLTGAAVLVALILIAALAMHLVTRALRDHVVDLLGPTGHAERIDVGLSHITLDQVVIKAPPGWPAEDTLRARRVELTPDLWKLLSHQVAIREATLDDAYLSILRGKDGKISLLPNLRKSTAPNAAASESASLTSAPASSADTIPHSGSASESASTASSSTSAQGKSSYQVEVGNIAFHGGTLDFFDGSVATPPFRLRVNELQANIGPLAFPSENNQTKVQIAGVLAGPKSNGPLNINGWVVFPTQALDIHSQFKQVDVTTLRPYLNKSKTLAIDSGLASLDVHSTVNQHHLHAEGRLVLDHLQLARGTDPLSTLESIPRDAAVAALKNKNGQINLDFTLDGDLSDPKFSLNENIATRLAAGLAKNLGLSTEGVARSVGDSTKGLGGALLNLIGK